ncbi:MAG TPA: M28 family peptidase, partial [Bryobacteraceae bacterium]|nr:M28 family peptidase [Bryobacteraceae bacterium]
EINWEQQARAIPDAARVRAFIEKLSNQPHLAGTPQSKETAEYILAQLREYGLDAHIEQYEALLPTPKTRELELIAPTQFRAKLEEPPVAPDKNSGDPGMVPSYNAYSGDGDVTAPLVYVNYGVPADYDLLKQQGIDVKGKIVIARYGGSWRGIKPKVAYEHGAVGCLIYSDPRDDGYFQGDVYPKGAFRPPDGVQRGSVMDMVLYPGDPLSPGWASEPGSKRLTLSEATTLMKIPVIPISYADAQPLLANLDGPVAPEAWRGALPITYHLGPGGAKVHLKVSMDNATRPLYDVIAKIPGSEFPDQWVLYGNHHDAWVHGASDPLSGAAPLLETARTLAELTRKGWKPKRTIMLAFWDGEEFGLVGSTEFMEKHAGELTQKLVAYLNSDSNNKGHLNVGGSHTLESFTQEIARDIKDPVSGRTLLEEAEAHSRRARGSGPPQPETPPAGEYRIAPLGSGSDYTPFLQHLGIATLDFGFSGDSGGGIYHSDYDDFYWYSHFADTNFVYGRTLAQVNSTAILRLADAPLLPFEFGRFAATVGRYLDEIEKLPNQQRKPDLSKVRTELAQLTKTAAAFDSAVGRDLPRMNTAAAEKLSAINQILYRSERDLTLDPGLPGRPWFRHRIYAPGMYTGYAVKTLPGIREAVEAGKPDDAEQQAKQVAQVLRALNGQVERATRLLGGL